MKVAERALVYARRFATVFVLTAALFAGLTAGASIAPDPPRREAAPVVRVSAAGAAAPRRINAPGWVRIPAIGVDAPLIPLGLNRDNTLAVPNKAEVSGWYAGGPRPGEVGPAVVVGHVDLHGKAGVFQRLSELRAGDKVEFGFKDGAGAVFVVTRSERVSKDAFPTMRVYGNTPGPELRLITCGGVFDRGSGHYRDNVIVYGKAAR